MRPWNTRRTLPGGPNSISISLPKSTIRPSKRRKSARSASAGVPQLARRASQRKRPRVVSSINSDCKRPSLSSRCSLPSILMVGREA